MGHAEVYFTPNTVRRTGVHIPSLCVLTPSNLEGGENRTGWNMLHLLLTVADTILRRSGGIPKANQETAQTKQMKSASSAYLTPE